MIKTLLAISLIALSGLNNVKRDTTDIIQIDGNNSYIGYEAEDFLINNKFNFFYTARNQNNTYPTISEALSDHSSYPFWSNSIKYGNQNVESYVLLAQTSANQNNVVELVKCNFILDYRKQTNQEQKIQLGLGDWNDASNRTITKEYTPSEYQILNILLPSNLNERNLYITSNIQTNAIMYSTIGYYNVKTYQVNGGLSPYKDLGSTNNVFINGNLEEFPQNLEPHKQQEILNSNFISNGQLWNSFDVYGISEQITYNPNTTYEHERARLEYRYAIYKNSYNSSSAVVNVIENGEINNWTDYNFRTITLLETDKASYINGIYQYQYGSLIKHINYNSYYQITANTDISNIFVLIGSAFDGFGNFFNVALMPGITIGALVTIPLLICLIIWLINMFKRH